MHKVLVRALYQQKWTLGGGVRLFLLEGRQSGWGRWSQMSRRREF